MFLREFYQALPLYQNVKTVFSIHNIAFQGQYSAKVLNDILGLAHIPAAAFQLTCGPDAVNYMQGALNYTDAITTVSPTYAEEIKTPDFGEHLDGILRRPRPILQALSTVSTPPPSIPRPIRASPRTTPFRTVPARRSARHAYSRSSALRYATTVRSWSWSRVSRARRAWTS